MAAKTTITITHDKEVIGDMKARYQSVAGNPKVQIGMLENLLTGISQGVRNASMVVTMDDGASVAASGTIAFSGVGAASDTILINGVTFTAVASGAVGNQWNVGGSATLSAANLAAAIVASATALVNLVTATAATGTVTITAVAAGTTGNAVTIAKGVDAGSVMTVSGARLTGGVNAGTSTAVSYAYGL